MNDPQIPQLSEQELIDLNSKKGLKKLLADKDIDIQKVLKDLAYEEELRQLQAELVTMQKWVIEQNKRVAILFEGRDAAGKGGTILRFTQHLRPREMRIVALPKPSEVEKGQWYFQRYVKQLPDPGEIVFFDRSWYNRAVVEPVMGFCTPKQYQQFMQNVPDFEHMLYEDGIILIKFWFAISKEEQEERFDDRRKSPLKRWKLSPVDEKAQKKWDDFTHYKNLMLNQTHTNFAPWVIVEANNKKRARLESIRYVLSHIDYLEKDKAEISLLYDPKVIKPYHKAFEHLDK